MPRLSDFVKSKINRLAVGNAWLHRQAGRDMIRETGKNPYTTQRRGCGVKQSVEQIDRNFLAGSSIESEELEWYLLPDERFEIRGLAEAKDGMYYRLPECIVDRVNEGVCTLGRHTAGGRIRFATDSTVIAYRAQLRYTGSMPHMPLTGSAGTDLFVDGRSVTTFRPVNDHEEWYEGFAENLPEDMKQVEMGLPLYTLEDRNAPDQNWYSAVFVE